jgi:hypothetical protein
LEEKIALFYTRKAIQRAAHIHATAQIKADIKGNWANPIEAACTKTHKDTDNFLVTVGEAKHPVPD